jgi:rhomboid protease GluP
VNILFWVVAIPTFSMFISALRRERVVAQGWILVSLTILITLFFAWLRRNNVLIYVAALMWGFFILLPGLLAKIYNTRLFEQQFAGAARLARAISVLHPFDGWREQPRMVHALELAQQGDVEAAVKILHEFRHLTSPTGLMAMIHLYRITHRWEEFLDWARQQPYDLESDPTLLQSFLRARGEVGDLRGMIELYDRHKLEIAHLAAAANSDFCRLILFSFSGRRDLVEKLFTGSLSIVPEATKRFWLATADMTAGKSETASHEFEQLFRAADRPTRLAVERRLSKRLPTAEALDAAHLRVVEEAAIEHTHEQIFDAAPSFAESRATRFLILLNVAVFALEILRHGTTDTQTLIALGAVYPPLVHQGEWWRLFAALFLHFGGLHIAMNMINLSVIGPFVEYAFGFVKFLALYFIAGVGSMFIVLTLSHHHYPTVGASGAIMGLVGATGGLMLKGWLRHRAHPAKRRLRAIIVILAIQTMFDAIIPQVSMTAHLSGALIGFATAILLPSNLEPENA